MKMIRRYPVATFFVLTYGYSWSAYAVVISLGLSVDAFPGTPILILGTFGPTLSAITLTAFLSGRQGVADLLRGVKRWRVDPRWYLFVFGFWAFGLVFAMGVAVVVGATPDFSALHPLYAFPMVFIVVILIGGPLQEEFGWRGYALPRLQASRTALRASLIVGVLWGLWHLPLFWMRATWHYEIVSGRPPLVRLFFMAFFVVATVALSIVYAWVYNSTQSLLLVVLLHAAVNTSDAWAPWPADQGGAMSWALIMLVYVYGVALVVVAATGARRLVRRTRTGGRDSVAARASVRPVDASDERAAS